MNEAEAVGRPNVEVLDDGNLLRIWWPNNVCSRFHAIWLRDNGQDAKTRDPFSYQKLVTLRDIPERTRINTASLTDDGQLEIIFQPDEWSTAIDTDWLWSHRYDIEQATPPALFLDHVSTWGGDFTPSNGSFPTMQREPRALLGWLRDIHRYGVARLEDVPTTPAAVVDVIELFGHPRLTNQGRYFEIKAEPKPANLASSALGLQTHTDNPYRDPVPTLQLFTCLQNDADGGESIVVDGFRAAEILKQEAPEHFELLTSHSAQFDFHGGGAVHLRASKPMIECSLEGQVIGVRFNNRSSDALTHVPFARMQDYYAAYRRFGELLSDPERQVSFKLQPGQLFITDNTRVLHGRKRFSGSGLRWMQGAYADKNALRSKILVLQRELAA